VVKFAPSDCIHIVANPEHDPNKFTSLAHLSEHVVDMGYYGGQRLILVRDACNFPSSRMHSLSGCDRRRDLCYNMVRLTASIRRSRKWCTA
jgi:hypothetical protein